MMVVGKEAQGAVRIEADEVHVASAQILTLRGESTSITATGRGQDVIMDSSAGVLMGPLRHTGDSMGNEDTAKPLQLGGGSARAATVLRAAGEAEVTNPHPGFTPGAMVLRLYRKCHASNPIPTLALTNTEHSDHCLVVAPPSCSLLSIPGPRCGATRSSSRAALWTLPPGAPSMRRQDPPLALKPAPEHGYKPTPVRNLQPKPNPMATRSWGIR